MSAEAVLFLIMGSVFLILIRELNLRLHCIERIRLVY
jgi:hypothetical protein